MKIAIKIYLMKKSLLLPLLLLLLWQVPSYADSAQDAEFYRGWEAYNFYEHSKAFEILKPLAENGHVLAQHYLGDLYYYGEGVAKNERKGKKWWRKAFKSLKPLAKSGDARAQFYLARSYYFGHGVAENKSEGKKWYPKAFKSLKSLSESGHANAQYYLGDLYYWGVGVAKNRSKAKKLYIKAAEQGHKQAQDVIAYWEYE